MDPEDRGLREEDLAADPFAQFRDWYAQLVAAGTVEPDAMVLATCSADGQPTARNVLLKGLDDRGFVFFTNYESRKAAALDANPNASLLFSWVPLRRQVLVTGVAGRIAAEESDVYFATRPRASQLGAWASPQSRVIADRAELEARLADVERRFAGGDVPRPPHWGGYRVEPSTIEFWQGRADRLHDRLRYTRDGGSWRVERIAP
jgi:pyridoxamine 5'-phosphate oxidase